MKLLDFRILSWRILRKYSTFKGPSRFCLKIYHLNHIYSLCATSIFRLDRALYFLYCTATVSADKRMLYGTAGTVSMLSSLLFLYLSLSSVPGSMVYFLNPESLGTFGNVIIYIVSGFIFLVLFLIMSLMVKYDKFLGIKLPKPGKYGIFLVAAIILSGIFLANGLLNEDWIFTPFELIVIGLVISALSVLAIYHEKKTVSLNWLFLFISLAIAILWGEIGRASCRERV